MNTSKKIVFGYCLLLWGCVTSKTVITPVSVLLQHPKPITIFGIGYWRPHFMVLTLLDARHDYFVIIAPRNDSLKIGQVYYPGNFYHNSYPYTLGGRVA